MMRALMKGSCAVVMLLASAGIATGQTEVYIPVTATPPVIDGVLAGDPGWDGASRIDLDVPGVAPITYLRLCRTTGTAPKIYIGLRVETGNIAPTSFDRIVLCFRPVDADDMSVTNISLANAHAWRIHIDPFSLQNNAGTYSPGGVQFWQDSSGWNNIATGTDPDMLSVAHWLQKANMKITCEAGGAWGFEMAVNVNTDQATGSSNVGVYIPGTNRFKFFADVVKLQGNSFACQYAWPRTLTISPTLTGGTPPTDSWGTASYIATASNTVDLKYNCIGLTIPPSAKNYMIAPYTPITEPNCTSINDAEHAGQMGPTNTLYAKPRNRMPTNANVGLTFSIANWGVPAPADWFQVSYPQAQCPPLTQLANPTPLTLMTPGLLKSVNLDWPLTYKQSCELGQVPQKSIKVAMTGDAETKFSENPVTRSIAVGGASTFEHEARIGTKGYPAPANGVERMLLTVSQDVRPRFVAGQAPSRPTTGAAAAAVVAAPRGFVPDHELYVSAEEFGAEEFDPRVKEAMTWTCRAYRRTGQTLVINDRPQQATVESVQGVGGFEYVVGHVGDAESWSSSFTGSGLRRRGDGLYEMEIPAGQVGLVRTTIEADDFRRWAFGFRAGFSIPHSDFGKSFDGGLTETATLEYRFTPLFSVEGRFAYAHFDGDMGVSDAGISSTSVNAKATFLKGDLQPFVNAGIGYYLVTPGNSHGGMNFGLGVRWKATDLLGVTVSYDYHDVFIKGDDAPFSAIQFGVDFRF